MQKWLKNARQGLISMCKPTYNTQQSYKYLFNYMYLTQKNVPSTFYLYHFYIPLQSSRQP